MTNLNDDPPKKNTTTESSEVLASTPRVPFLPRSATLDWKNRAKLKASDSCVRVCVFENLARNTVGQYAIEFDQPVA